MKTNCVGIDIGYGFTKTHTDEGSLIFPTAVSEFHQKITFSDLQTIKVNGEQYIVGEQALNEGRTVDTRTSSFVTSNAWIAILSHALSEVNFSGGELVLGVPPGLYTKEYGDRILDSMKRAEISIGRQSDPYRFNGNVRIIPQGVGIYFAYVNNHPEDYSKNVVVVDIGHRTVDMISIADEKYVERAKMTKNLGVSCVLDDIIANFASTYRLEITHREALKILKDGKLSHIGNDYPIDPREELHAYATQLTSVIENYLENTLSVDRIILGGGGSIIVKDLITLRHSMIAVEKPEYANAMGYWWFGMTKSKGAR